MKDTSPNRLREFAVELLDAVRGVPPWNEEPTAKCREWWHRMNEGGGCSYADCNRSPCYCDPETDQEMQRRVPRGSVAPNRRARQIYDRYCLELDGASAEIGELIANLWMPNENRRRLIELLSGLSEQGVIECVEDLLVDPKVLAILRALENPAETHAETALRTSCPVVSESTVRKLSKKLQDKGLIERVEDSWHRTAEGTGSLDRNDM